MTSKVVTLDNYNKNNKKKNKQILLLLSKAKEYKRELDEVNEKYIGLRDGAVDEIKKLRSEKINLERKIKEMELEIKDVSHKYEISGAGDSDMDDLGNELELLMKPLEQELKLELREQGYGELLNLLL